MQASLYCRQECQLGEGVLYDHRRSQLLWIDIEGKCLFVLDADGKNLTKHRMPELIGFVTLSTEDRYVVGLQSGLYYYHSREASLSSIYPTSENLKLQLRWNDGKCSPQGDIWAGTMHLDEAKTNQGGLFRLDRNGKTQKVIEKVSISNGLAWHDDLQRMYYIDSPTRQIQVFNYDKKTPQSIELYKKLDLPEEMGYPDGMTIDLDGMLWVAHWDGGCIARWHPETGQLINKIDIPAPRVTSCSFGGPDKSRLFISTARIGLSKEQLAKYPLSGSIFVIDTNTNGVESAIYGL